MIDAKAITDCCYDPKPYIFHNLISNGLIIAFIVIAGFLTYKNRKNWKRCLAIIAISLCLTVITHYAINAIYIAINY